MSPSALFLFFAALAPAGAPCLPVSGPQILAGDMARLVPVFARIAADLPLGYAPAAGSRRTYASGELTRLARRYGLTLEPGTEACFVQPLETLTRERVIAALAAAMPMADIEVVEFGRQPVPEGELQFPISGLPSPTTGSVLFWRGMVHAVGRSDFPVWAKVRIQVSGKRAVSREALAPGQPIQRDKLREETYHGPPGFPSLPEVVGRAPRRPIAAGIAIERQWLDEPVDVLRGERVQVEIRSGPARIVLEGESQSSGRRGQEVGVRNPSNGRILHGVISARGRVLVTVSKGEIEDHGEK